MKRKIYSPPDAACLGHFVHATQHHGVAYIGGQMSLDPLTGEIVHGTVAEQTDLALSSLKNLVEGMGAAMEDVLMVNIYLSSMAIFEEMNGVYRRYFPENPPARAAVAVKELYDHLDVELTAVVALAE